MGVDISTLAHFVAEVKTTVFSEVELDRLEAWAKRVHKVIDIRKSTIHFAHYAERGYYKHLDHPNRWRLRKAIEQGIGSAIRLGDERLEAFGRCALLRTAQWALDSRKEIPTVGEFRATLENATIEMVQGARALRAVACADGHRRGKIEVLNRSAAGLETDKRGKGWQVPRNSSSPPRRTQEYMFSIIAGRLMVARRLRYRL